MYYILMEHQYVYTLMEHLCFIILWNLYSTGAAVFYMLKELQCVIFLWSISMFIR